MSTLLSTSNRNTMRPLVWQGIETANCGHQLRSYLKRNEQFLAEHGMPDAGSFLAEPLADPSTGKIDWYADGNGSAKRLTDLEGPEREQAEATLAQYGKAMQDLISSSSSAPGRAGSATDAASNLLKLAMQHPSQDDIFLVDGKPVLTNWGFVSGSIDAEPEDIMRKGAGAPRPVPLSAAAPLAQGTPTPQGVAQAAPSPQATTPPPARPIGFLSWLPSLLFLLLLLWLLASLLGLCPFPLPAGCTRTDGPDFGPERIRHERLADEHARLLTELEKKAEECRPEPKPKDTPVPQPAIGPLIEEPEAVIEKPEAIEEKPAELPYFGDDEKVEPKVDEKPEQKPKKEEALAIPEDNSNDLGFLEGCWKSQTGLINSRTHEPVIVEYCFDKKGNGHRLEYERNGSVCRGKARARFNGNKLQIEADAAKCKNGTGYVPQSVQCTGKGKQTRCTGREKSQTDPTTWSADFHRK